jgi:predicted transcriptional regulator
MAIERKNSFHLLLSDDELKLLRLLAEREGLNASDYLRSVLRQLAGTPPHLAQVIRLGAALGGKIDLSKAFESHSAMTKSKTKKAK